MTPEHAPPFTPACCPQCRQPLTAVGQFLICPQHGQVSLEKPSAPMRIFLSYGHDANEELVRRIKADLEKRGHDVWFDRSEIRFGDDWRRAITDGIVASNRVLSFLSKYSTRDPGVCLDELAIAIGVKGGNIQTILVESETEVKAPPTIGHIQWLDMHDWKAQKAAGDAAWEAWYRSKLAEIVRVIESDESRRFSGEIDALNGYLKPISSDSRISALLRRGFVGRVWLFDAIEQWRNAPNRASRLFWIVGDPGVGKSAAAAYLTHFGRDKVIAAQFVEWDKPDHRSADRVVRSLAFQLATRLPEYRKLLLTLPEIAELDRKDPAELFDYLLANPLRSVIGGGRGRYLVVIDALDEAGDTERNPLVDMLARSTSRLPGWIGIVVTSRPESAVKTPLQGLKPFILDTRTEGNRSDIRDYVRHELALQLKDRPDADHLVEQVVEKSEGVFLYVERFCDDVQQGHLSLDRPEQFPQGLGGVFCQFFDRQFPDLERFRKVARPALRAILAALEPLPVEILQRLFNWQDEELRDFTRALGSLFPVTAESGTEVIKPYHKSLVEWMADEAKAGPFYVSAIEGDRLLAELGWGQFVQGVSTISGYFLSHLPAHLARMERWESAVSLLTSDEYVKAAAAFHTTRRDTLLEDYRKVFSRAPVSQRTRLWRASAACSVLALNAIASMVDQGSVTEAKALLEDCAGQVLERQLPEVVSTFDCLVGRIAIYENNRQEAESRLAEALSLARDAGYQEGVARALLNTGVLLRRFGASGECDAQHILQRALESHVSTSDANLRSRVLLNLAMVHIHKGQVNEAEKALATARALVEGSSIHALGPWVEKYTGFLEFLQRNFEGAAERFHSAGELFGTAGNDGERSHCSELMACSLAWHLVYGRGVSGKLIDSFDGEARGKVEREVIQLRSLMMESTILNESDTQIIATATQRFLEVIRSLQQRYDPRPPAGLIHR